MASFNRLGAFLCLLALFLAALLLPGSSYAAAPSLVRQCNVQAGNGSYGGWAASCTESALVLEQYFSVPGGSACSPAYPDVTPCQRRNDNNWGVSYSTLVAAWRTVEACADGSVPQGGVCPDPVPVSCPAGKVSVDVGAGYVKDGTSGIALIALTPTQVCVASGGDFCFADAEFSGAKLGALVNGSRPVILQVVGTINGVKCPGPVTPSTVLDAPPACDGTQGVVNGVSVCIPAPTSADKAAAVELAAAQAASVAVAAAKAAGATDAAAAAAGAAAGAAAKAAAAGGATPADAAKAGAAAGAASSGGAASAAAAGAGSAAESAARAAATAAGATQAVADAAASAAKSAAAAASAAAALGGATASGAASAGAAAGDAAAADVFAKAKAAGGGAAGDAAAGAASGAGGTAATEALKAAAAALAKLAAKEDKNPISDFCDKNPKSPICKQGADSTWAGSCAAPPACSGDAIQCSIAAQALKTACALSPDPSQESRLYDSEKTKTGSVMAGLPGESNVTFNASSFDQTNFLGSASGMGDITIVVMGRTIVLPFSTVNIWLERLGIIMQACTFILCYRIVSRG